MSKPTEKEMYPYVYANLRARYPLNDGWEIHFQDRRGKHTYIPDFVVERKIKNITYKIPVEVKCTCKAIQADINQINRYSKSLSGPNIFIPAKFLVYPSGADISILSDDIKVILLRNINCG